MWHQCIFLAFLGVFCTIASAQTGVCYVSVSTQVSRTEQYSDTYTRRYSCGLFGWRRCRRTLSRPATTTVYFTEDSPQFGCCPGYQQSSSTTCLPVCNGGCANGGTCVSPNRCSCLAGYTGNNCQSDINECATSSSNRCAHNCHNTVGSYTCSCNTGYSLSSNGYDCIDDNECTLGTAMCMQICHNNAGSYTCSCHVGYSLDADRFACLDNDECALGTHACAQNCDNTVGTYTCSCNTGYTLNNNGRTCDDDDECALGTARCVQNCHNNAGSYTCSCQVGYSLDADGFTCNDNDECSLGTHACDQNCHNNVGSYTCSCNAGYTLNSNGRSCDDNDECLTFVTNGCQHVCVNEPGSYRCECNIGYSLNLDQRTCRDINECVTGTDNCDHICHNNVGSFTCTCNTGTTLASNGYTCLDINECSHPDTNSCEQVCNNTEVSYFCDCLAGYSLNPDQITCSDIDECETETDMCAQNCGNTIGSYTCSCDDGYTLNSDRRTCDDFDECADGTYTCTEVCVNTAGSYTCACRGGGYQISSDGFSCQDVDECAEGTDRCQHLCNNTIGSYSCSCRDGYIIDEDGYTCDDVIECGGDHGCQQACNNTLGSYHCACFPGYVINNDGITCRDLDECAAGVHECDGTCLNTIGSYTCSCDTSRYTLNSDGRRCDDIDECLEGRIGNVTCPEQCVNLRGSWRCGCNLEGYIVANDGRTCRDENECTEGENECDQLCLNTVGSYNCSCNSTTTLNQDGLHCDDVDECLLDLDDCAEICVNVYGAHYCSCNVGYTINTDGRTCRDADECLDGSDLCEQVCTNTMGSYTCGCNAGYSLTSNLRSCLGTPEDVDFSFINSTSMTLTWGTPVDDSNDGTILSYTVYCSSAAFPITISTLPGAAERREVLRNLSPFTSYNCCVSVQTDSGNSPFSCIQETTLEEEPVNPPESVTINNEDANSLSFEVEAPLIPNGIIIAYTFYVTYEDGSTEVIVDRDLTGVFMLEGLLPYQLVSVEVSANTTAGEGPKSVVDEIRTAQAAPSVPTGVVVGVTSNSSIAVGWNPPTMANGVLLNYTVSIYNTLNDYYMTVSLLPYDTRSISVEDLDPFVPYTVEIKASTIAGEGETYSKMIFTQHGIPDVPTVTSVVRTGNESAKVFWIPLTPDEARGVLTQLQIAYHPATNGMCSAIDEEDMMTMTMLEDIDTQSEAIIDGLVAGVEYCVAIQVSTSAGTSGHGNILKAQLASDEFVQIRFQLSNESCPEYIDVNTMQKATDISSAVVQILLLACNCPYSLEYVTHSRLLCDPNNAKEFIYQSNLLNTDSKTASELKVHIQEWVVNKPKIMISGALQKIDPYCRVSVAEIGDTKCLALSDPTTPTVVDATTEEGIFTDRLTAIIAGSVGAVVGTLLLLFMIGCILCVYSRNSNRVKENIRKKDTRKPLAVGDYTQLVGQDIRTLPRHISSTTPANYDTAPEFDNPMYDAMDQEASQEVVQEGSQGSFDDGSFDDEEEVKNDDFDHDDDKHMI